MPSNKLRRGGRKNRKHGRNKVKCALYRAVKSEPNKINRLTRHLRNFPGDAQARRRLLEIQRHGVAAD